MIRERVSWYRLQTVPRFFAQLEKTLERRPAILAIPKPISPTKTERYHLFAQFLNTVFLIKSSKSPQNCPTRTLRKFASTSPWRIWFRTFPANVFQQIIHFTCEHFEWGLPEIELFVCVCLFNFLPLCLSPRQVCGLKKNESEHHLDTLDLTACLTVKSGGKLERQVRYGVV